MNNNFFSLNRFGMVLKKDIKSVVSNGGTTILSFLSGYLLYFLINMVIGKNYVSLPDDRFPVAIFFMLIGAFMLPFKLYPGTNDPKYGIHFVMLPASAFEKFISMIIVTLTTQILFVLLFCSFDALLSLLPFKTGFFGTFFTRDLLFNKDSLDITLVLLLSVSYLIFGNLAFKRHKPSKTMIMIVLINTAVILLGIALISFFHLEISGINISTVSGMDVRIFDNPTAKTIGTIDLYLYLYGLPLLFYTLSFFRIKNQKY